MTGSLPEPIRTARVPMDISDKIEKLEHSIHEVRLESREEFRKVDVRLARIEAVLPTFATKVDLQEIKADLQATKADLIKWVVGTAIGLGAVAITVMTFVLNNATPHTATPAAPLITQMPMAPATPAPPATALPGRS